MKPTLLIAAFILLAIVSVLGGSYLLQVAPTTGSIKTWSWEDTTGEAEYRGSWPQTQGLTAAATTSPHTGISLRLFSTQLAGSGSWSISYEVRCGGALRGTGATQFGAYYDGTKSPVWVTIVATSSFDVITAGDPCSLAVSVSGGPGGPSSLRWEFRQSKGLSVVWGEPYTPAPGEPSPPVSPEQPPSDPIVEDEGPPPPPPDRTNLTTLLLIAVIVVLIIVGAMLAFLAFVTE